MMSCKNLSYWLLGLMAVGCRAPLNISNVQTQKNITITDKIEADQEMTNIIAPYKTDLEGKMKVKISHTSVELNKTGDDSNLGNLLCDFTMQGAEQWAKANGYPSVDAAVINIGGIRTIIPKGDITIKNIYEVMPFENEVVIVKMKGSDLQGLFDYYLKMQVNNPVSKLRIDIENGKLVQQLVDGRPVDPDKTYYIATSDYLAMGGDSMFFFGKGEMISTGIKMRELFLEKFKENPEIVAPTDVRLTFKK